MINLYSEIEWAEFTDADDVDYDYMDLTKMIRSVCDDYQSSNEFTKQGVHKPDIDMTYSNYVLLIGLPKVSEAKSKKLKMLFKLKIMPKLKLQDGFVDMEFDFEEGEELGTGNGVIEFKTPEYARAAQDKLNGLKIPPNFVLSAVTFDTFNDITDRSNTDKEYSILQREELLHHLTDDFQRDQITVLVNDTGLETKSAVEFHWHNDVEGNAEEIQRNNGINASSMKFSQSSAYLATIHNKGFGLYGGKEFQRLRNFTHFGVKKVKFSKNDKFVASFNGVTSLVNGTKNIIIWNLITGEKIRHFTCHHPSHFDLLDWSHDEEYLGIIVRNKKTDFLCVYEAEKMTMVANKEGKRLPVAIDHPKYYKWANTKNEISFVCYRNQEGDVESTKAGIVQIPTGDILKWMGLNFEVKSCSLRWEERDYFVVAFFDVFFNKPEQLIQIGRPNYQMMSINVKVETLNTELRPFIAGVSIDNKARNYAIFWSKSDKDLNYNCVYKKILYNPTKKKLDVIESMELLQCGYRDVVWSNIENLFCLKQRGQIAIGQFHDSKKPHLNKFTGILNEVSVSNNSWVQYDTSGRYVATFEPTIQKFQVFNAFGLLRFVKTFKSGTQVLWRNIPPVIIDRKMEKAILKMEIPKNMKPLEKMYVKGDEARREKYNEHVKHERGRRENLFFARMKDAKIHWEETREERSELFGCDPELIKNPVEIWYVDKKEEYERKAA